MSTIVNRVRVRFQGSQEPSIQERVASRYVMATKVAGARWDGKIVGKDCRLQWNRNEWLLEELPQKGKKKLRVANMQNIYGIYSGRMIPGLDGLMPENILRDAKPGSGDNYEGIKKKIESVIEDALKQFAKDAKKSGEDWDWVLKGQGKWYENQVYFLEVIPEDVHPFKAEGKDFTVDVAWGDFKAFSPNSDLQNQDPSYTKIREKSPGAARKLYNTLKTEPTALKSVPWSDFTKWLDTKKIGYKHEFSQWH